MATGEWLLTFVLPLRRIILTVLGLLVVPAIAPGETVTLGMVSFDLLIPRAPESPSVNTFSITNLTGDPSQGGNAVPPSFPVLTPVTFRNSSLLLDSGGTTQRISLGDLGPGFASPAALHASDTLQFSSAFFSAGLSVTSLQLQGGGTLTVSSPVISASLTPPTGGVLTAGTDFTLITVSDQAIPEPTSGLLVALALIGMYFRHARSA